MRGIKNKVHCRPQTRTAETKFPHNSSLSSWCYHEQNSLHATLSSHFIPPSSSSSSQLTDSPPAFMQPGWLLNLHKHPLALVSLHNQMNPNLHQLFCLAYTTRYLSLRTAETDWFTLPVSSNGRD